MRLWPRPKPSPFAGLDFLDLVPARAVDADTDPETGHVVVLLPRFRDRVLGRLLQPSLPEARRWVRVRLDAKGSLLWREADGERPIRALVPRYEAVFPDDTENAPERVCQWFWAGYESGLLTLRK